MTSAYSWWDNHRPLVAVIIEALHGLPMTATALEVNARLRERAPFATLGTDASYQTWRRIVRAVQYERARWVEWEGGDSRGVRPAPRRRRVTRTGMTNAS